MDTALPVLAHWGSPRSSGWLHPHNTVACAHELVAALARKPVRKRVDSAPQGRGLFMSWWGGLLARGGGGASPPFPT